MFKKISLITGLLVLSYLTHAQTGKITGKIVDAKTGETLPGATVLLEGTTKGASSDFDGNFSLNNVPAGTQVLLVSFITYDTKRLAGVKVPANDILNLNITLDQSSSQTLGEVIVQAEVNKENNTALVMQQKNNASVSDGISAETIKRTPDRNTSDVLKRVSGVTIQDDKFVIIRGLNERYNASYLNGSPLPSTEPDKKAFAFDLFPSNMLDNIVISKTATPDMPGEFAGGIVQINTKSIPEKNFISVSGGLGYNTVTTGKAKTIYDGGKYDKFGFDDGSRNLPLQVPSLQDKATWIANKDQARVAGYFNNDWGYSQSTFAPNSSAQIAAGYNFKLKDRDFLGVIASLGYNSTQSLYTLQRTEYNNIHVFNTDQNQVVKQNETFNKINQTQTSTGALVNLACKINNNNTISLKNMLTGYADNKFISANGINYNDAPDIRNRINARYFTANKILSSQLNGDHLLEKSKIKIGWNAGISTVQRSVPDLRMTSYSKSAIHNPDNSDPKDTVYKADIGNGGTAGPNYAGYRVYSQLNETIRNAKIDISRPFKVTEDFKIEAKVGGFYQDRTRQYNIRQFGLNQYSQGTTIYKDDSLLYLPEGQIFAPQNMGVTPVGTGGFKATEITHDDDNYRASSKLYGGYGMVELKLKDKLRLIGGLRYESYTQQVNVQYKKVDSVIVKSTINDYLPSVNLIYNINKLLGIRLAYSKTLNRAEFRELAVTNWFDPETKLSIAGNAGLKRCYIQNFDSRFEIYPGRGQLFTVSGFYKYFNSPIERYMISGSESQIYYRNANFATVYGGELEYRVNVGAILKKDSIKFLNNLNLFSNLSLIKSEVNVAGLNSAVPDTRTMQGQAPYIINAGISYIDVKNGFSVTGMVNRVGDKIYIVGNEIDVNRWEKARTVIDLQATKSFFKNKLEIRLNVKDLLHKDYIIYYKGNVSEKGSYNPKTDYVNFKRNFGSTYSFIVSYRF